PLKKVSLLFLLAWSSVFLGSTYSLNRNRKSDIGLKSLEELVLIRKTLDAQALKLRGLQINLHRVLSKVVLLSYADVHSPETFSSKEEAPPLAELSKRLDMLLERLNQEDKMSTKLLELNECPIKVCHEPFLNQTSLKELSKDKDEPKVDFYQPAKSDCHELDTDVRVDGVYRFLVPERNEVQRDLHERYCAFATDGPAWTVIQSRGGSFDPNPPENFNRSWDEYRAGFGNLSRDFWFGNEFTHKILYRDDHELRVELQEEGAPLDWAEYPLFWLDSESYNYQLSVDGEFRGSLPDALEQNNRMDFSTYDRRRSAAKSAGYTCAEDYGGGWWFDLCTQSNLNGELGVHQRASPAIIWMNWRTGTDKTKSSRMMIRLVNSTTGDNSDED
ncbi:techylectin-5A, partial [Drosophila erecta]|uniref:techylectin-5A n=1 Tax=Drosophila erecta TaxID=7220 RepID=UPI000F054303